VLQMAVRQAGRAPSFKEASEDLKDLAGLSISPTHVGRLSERVGREWAQLRADDAQAFQQNCLPCAYAEPPQVAAVMIDGGRVQQRAEGQSRGVHDPGWCETKVACCLSLASPVQASDPQPEPPSKFLDPVQVARLAAELKARGRPALGRTEKQTAADKKRRKRRLKKRRPRVRRLVRTVVASTANSATFGWQMAAEVQHRGLDRARRKACVCDGQHYNWGLFELHLLPWGFLGILDFLHLLGYLYGAAHALWKKGSSHAWRVYERWLRWAWSGKVSELLKELRSGQKRLGLVPAAASEDDPRRIVSECLTYVKNNRARMNYPEYRRLGLPISSAPVESVIKQLNRRIKGTEKFWVEGGADAILQVRAAYLSEDGRAERYWSRPRPYARAAGGGRLRPGA
jgi:hypothetical protein